MLLRKCKSSVYQNILNVCWAINWVSIKHAAFGHDPACREMNWCFLNAELEEEKAHCSLKRSWDWSSLCAAPRHIRESCSLSQSDCGPSCKAALTHFHIQSPLFVQFIAETINITNVSLWDAKMKATIELSNHQRKHRRPYTGVRFIWSWIDLHSNNTLFFLSGPQTFKWDLDSVFSDSVLPWQSFKSTMSLIFWE